MDGDARPLPRVLPGLTSLRFFAAMWVVVYHYVWWLPGGEDRPIPLISSGHLGVGFFFVLSGFILTHAHYGQITDRRLAVRPFLTKRIAKIYPMHLATLLFYVALIGAVRVAGLELPNQDRYTVPQLLMNLFLVHGWQVQDAGAWNYPSWSISAEWFAYLLFPLVLAPVLIRRTRAVAAPWLVLASLGFFGASVLLSPVVFGVSYFGLHSNFGYVHIVPEFVLGMALYRLARERELPWLAARPVLPALVVTAALFALLEQDFLVTLVLALTILTCAERHRHNRDDVMAHAGLVYLGEISFSLYMVHVPVATLLLQGARLALGSTPLWAVLLAVPVAVMAAGVAYRLIEKPSHRFVLRFSRGRRAQPQFG